MLCYCIDVWLHTFMTAMHGHSRSYNVQAVLVNFILGAFVLARENNFDICLYSKQKRLGRAII